MFCLDTLVIWYIHFYKYISRRQRISTAEICKYRYSVLFLKTSTRKNKKMNPVRNIITFNLQHISKDLHILQLAYSATFLSKDWLHLKVHDTSFLSQWSPLQNLVKTMLKCRQVYVFIGSLLKNIFHGPLIKWNYFQSAHKSSQMAQVCNLIMMKYYQNLFNLFLHISLSFQYVYFWITFYPLFPSLYHAINPFHHKVRQFIRA